MRAAEEARVLESPLHDDALVRANGGLIPPRRIFTGPALRLLWIELNANRYELADSSKVENRRDLDVVPFCHGCKSEKPDALMRLLREISTLVWNEADRCFR